MTVIRPVQASMFPDIAPDKPTGPILPSVFVGTNADLMAAVAPLYLTGSVCDVTYGDGNWWTKYRPADFVAHDKYKLDGVDFTDLPEQNNTYDAVCYDPPYVISGGPSSANLDSDLQGRFGIGTQNMAAEPPFEDLLRRGLWEAIGVSRCWVLVKCMEFAQGGTGPRGFHDTPYMMTKWAIERGAYKHDQIVHHTGSGPGGHNIFEPKRARRHHSYLLVFKKAPSTALAKGVDR